jgi:hypothetical protein
MYTKKETDSAWEEVKNGVLKIEEVEECRKAWDMYNHPDFLFPSGDFLLAWKIQSEKIDALVFEIDAIAKRKLFSRRKLEANVEELEAKLKEMTDFAEVAVKDYENATSYANEQMKRAEKAESQVYKFNAIIDILPRIASGEPAIEGMNVYALCNTKEGFCEMKLTLCAAFDSTSIGNCYSTRAAALEAAQQKGQK